MSDVHHRPTRAVIDLEAVARNVAHLVERAAPARLCVVVKADGYGHGAVPVARAALGAGAGWLAVALVEEALELRAAGIGAPILLLSPAPASGIVAALEADVDLTVDGRDAVAAVAAAVAGTTGPTRLARVHLKIDTGMHRMGAAPDEAVGVARHVVAAPGVTLAGTWTHLARADEPDVPTTAVQQSRFEEAVAAMRAAGIDPGLLHVANSAGALAHPATRFDMVRCGLASWGIAPGPAMVDDGALTPALSLVSAVSARRRVRAGEGVSYGHHWVADRDTTVVTVPIGYADGVRRDAGFRGVEVLVGGCRRPIVGAVTMDQLMVDVCDDDVGVGDEVVLIGRQGGVEVTATEWAARLDTIPYEVVCAIGRRVPRIHLGGPTAGLTPG